MKARTLIVIASLLILQGCAAAVVGAGVGVASVANDRRTVGTQIDDKTSEGKVVLALEKNEALEQANVNIQVYNGVLLLVGQAPTEALKRQAEQAAKTVPTIRKVHNLIRVTEPVGASIIASDVALALKVRAQLLADERVDGFHVSVTVEDSEVFLMGLVNQSEANMAVEVTRNVNGVARVVKAFEYL